MKKLLLFFLILFNNNLCLYAQYSGLKVNHITVNNGLSSNRALSVYQDSKGYAWIGTVNGLNLYDGQNIQIFLPIEGDSTSLSNPLVNAITEDLQGNIWIGTRKGLNCYSHKTRTFKQFFKGDSLLKLPQHQITSLYTDKKGRLWIGTMGGLVAYTPNEQGVNIYLKKIDIRGISEDLDGNIWVASTNGLYYIKDGKGHSYDFVKLHSQAANPYKINGFPSRVVLCDSKNRIWLGTEYARGLISIDLKTNTVKNYDYNQYIRGLVEDKKGNIWVAGSAALSYLNPETEQKNVFYLDTDNPFHTEGKELSFCNRLIKDRQGGTWMITESEGLYYYHPNNNKFRHIKMQKSLHINQSTIDNQIFSIYQDAQKDLWVGTRKALRHYSHYNKNFFAYTNDVDVNQKNFLSGNTIKAIEPDHKGGLWIGTFKGINHINTKTKTIKHFEKGPGVNALCLDNKERLWIVAWKGLKLLDTKNNQFNKATNKSYISSSDISKKIKVRDILQDSKGLVWLGGSHTLAYFDEKAETFMHFRPDTSDFETLGTNCIFIDSQQHFWVGTQKHGLFLFDQQSKEFINYKLADRLKIKTIFGILEENKDSLWMSTNQGLFQVSIAKKINSTNHPKLTFKKYGLKDGLLSTEFNAQATFKSQDGEMFFGTLNGINAFYPSDIKKDVIRIPVHISSFNINNQHSKDSMSANWKAFLNNKKITLAYDQTTISFDYVGIYFPNPKEVVYAYKLEGYDKDWNYAKDQKFAKFTNLPRGENYRFRVKAKVGDNPWYECKNIPQIYIELAFWETLWFRVLMVLLILSLFFAFYKIRLSAIQKQKKKLSALVEMRTQELKDKNESLYETQQEVTTQNEELLQQAEELITQRDFLDNINQKLEKANNEIKLKESVLIKNNEKLKKSREETENSKKELEVKNSQINTSIRAAKTIQQAILPHEAKMKQLLNDYFIIYRPKDIVSGDFYWIHKIPDKVILVAADCTGHGVPGAFMTLIGNILLDRIVNLLKIINPADILEKLHEEVNAILRQKYSQNNNGMDLIVLSLETLNHSQTKLTFSGAKNDLYYITPGNPTLFELKGTRKGIGGKQNDTIKFCNKEIIISKDTFIYVGSDGLMDQNNVKRRKFGKKRLKEVILKNSKLPLIEQKNTLEQLLDEHMKNTQQRDDILWIGFKI